LFLSALIAAKIPGRRVSQGAYSAFVPAPLPPVLEWTLRLIRMLSDADRLIGRLAGEGGRLPNPHVLMRPFLRREAVLSSRIEGKQATLGELLAAEAGAVVDRSPEDLREVGESPLPPRSGPFSGKNGLLFCVRQRTPSATVSIARKRSWTFSKNRLTSRRSPRLGVRHGELLGEARA